MSRSLLTCSSWCSVRAAPGRLVLAAGARRSCSASCRSGSSTTCVIPSPRRSRCGCWCASPGPLISIPRPVTRSPSPFPPATDPCCPPSSSSPTSPSSSTSASSRYRGRDTGAEDYFLAGPIARQLRLPALAVRHEHDGLRHPGLVRPRLQQRHRDLRPDGVVVGAGHPAQPLPDRHAASGRSANATGS